VRDDSRSTSAASGVSSKAGRWTTSADEHPDPKIPQDPGIPGDRATRERPSEPEREPEPLPPEDPDAVSEEPDQEGQRTVE
jgi:hypothetical protein